MNGEGLKEALLVQFAEEALRAAGGKVELLSIGRGVAPAMGPSGVGASHLEREGWLSKLCDFASEIGTLAVGTAIPASNIPDPEVVGASSLEVEKAHLQYEPFAVVVLKVEAKCDRVERRAFVAVASCVTCEGRPLSVEEVLGLRVADEIPPSPLRLKPMRMKEAFREAISIALKEAAKFVDLVRALSAERFRSAASGIEALYYELVRETLEEGGDPEALRRSMARRVDQERRRLSVSVQAHISAAATLYVPVEVRQLSATTWGGKRGSFVVVAVPFVGRRARASCGICGRASEEVVLCSCGRAACSRYGDICPSCGHGRCKECSTKCAVCGEGLCPACSAKCEVCGSPMCRDHIVICPLCERTVCPAHAGVCPSCGRKVCFGCAKICVGCERAVCPEHVRPCPHCGSPTCGRAMCMPLCTFCERKVCVDCVKECAICGRPICSECSLTCSTHGKPLCPDHALKCHSCGRALCQRSALRCAKCGQPLCPDCSV
ncbi:MAG TPA: hypothetical protein EYP65_09030, partial [Armatimonadetes bacterium]|nr:hypothetical protein [Armatimonadota bacterium]